MQSESFWQFTEDGLARWGGVLRGNSYLKVVKKSVEVVSNYSVFIAVTGKKGKKRKKNKEKLRRQ